MIDVHTEHCCRVHGCKYGNPECTVETGEKKQSFMCEECEYVLDTRAHRLIDPTDYPMQPIYLDENKTARFKSNALVSFLLGAGPYDMNKLAYISCTPEERMQFAQLIGYSVCGYGELSYASPESVMIANEAVDKMMGRRA